MTILSRLIHKRADRTIATAIPAIPAIPATRKDEDAGTVAKIATVAIANTDSGQTANPRSDAQPAFIAVHKAALVQPATPEREPLTAVEAMAALHRAGFSVSEIGRASCRERG